MFQRSDDQLSQVRTPYRPWLAAWVGAAAIAVVNGAARERFLAPHLSEQRAHQVSSLSLATALGGYAVALQRACPIPSNKSAFRIGAAWVGMTLAFETGFGRLQGQSWRSLLAAYDLRRGQVWGLVVLWIGAVPLLTRPATARGSGR